MQGELNEDEEMYIKELNQDSREWAWRDFVFGRFELHDDFFSDWSSTDRISMEMAKLRLRIVSARKACDARDAAVLDEFYK